MAFEVQPTGLRPRHPRLGIAAAVLIGAVLIGLGLATRPFPGPELDPPAFPSGSPAVARPVALASPPLDSHTDAQPGSLRPLPTTLDCRDVTREICTKAASAALSILQDDLPAVSGVTVWRSLVCSDLPDCPPQLLTRDTVPLGSVIVSFADVGPEAWINVVERQAAPDGSATEPAKAWIVRWH